MSRALWQKLGYRPGLRAVADEAPEHYPALLAGLPDGVEWVGLDGRPALVHHFTTTAVGLGARLAVFADAIERDGMVWVSWPKKASGVPTDVDGDAVRAAAFPLGLVDVKVCAVDAVWTAMKLVIRTDRR